jgi:hypothetical protein
MKRESFTNLRRLIEMKKKVMMIGAGLTVGSALLITSAFAGIGGSEGYEAYKDALKASASITNATQHVTVKLSDNGNPLLEVKAKVKDDQASGAASGSVTLRTGAAEAGTYEFYDWDGQTVMKSSHSDTYRLFDEPADEWEARHGGSLDASEHAAISNGAERIVDALVGNLKNNFVLEQDADGGAIVNVELSGAQIPAVANTIGSLIIKEAMNGEHKAPEPQDIQAYEDVQDLLGIDLEQLGSSMPRLTDNVNIDRVGLKAELDANDYIDSHDVSFTISGTDEAGKAHTIVLQASIEVTDRNATKPDTIDLNGLKVEKVDLERYGQD